MRIWIPILVVAISASIIIHSTHAQDRPRVVVIPLMGDCDEAQERMGTASTANVLFGETFSNDNGSGLIGLMPDRGAMSIKPGTSNQSIPAGYHNGAGSCAGDADLAAENIKSGVEIFDVAGTAIEASGNATANQVLSGRTFSNATVGGLIGTMPDNGAINLTPGTTARVVAAGYHSGFGTVAGDTDLVSSNIKSGVEIFGVLGDSNVVDTTSGDAGPADILSGKTAWVNGSEVTGTASSNPYPAPVARTGQKTSYDTADDGALQKGVVWPNPRFTNNGDGTVTDNLTGLIWLRNANCFGNRNWITAISNANGLASGSCGLSDGSTVGDWRLPNAKEMSSLIDYNYVSPALPNAAGNAKWSEGNAFSNVSLSSGYWTSTTYVFSTSSAFRVIISWGDVRLDSKSGGNHIWPVRDPD